MIRMHTSKITLFQLFFLSFSYVFSGFFLIGERSFLSLWIPVGMVLLFSAWGYFLLKNTPRTYEGERKFVSFLSCAMPKSLAAIWGVILVLSAIAEALLSWIAFCFSVRAFASFIPFWFVFVTVGVLIFFVASHGLTAVGRLAELMAFLIVPLVFYLLLWRVSPMDITAFSSDLHILFTVTPAPILYLFSVTVSKSTAMPDEKSLRSFPLASFLGAVVAVLCAVLFVVYGASGDHIFFLFFGWMTSVIRMGILLNIKI